MSCAAAGAALAEQENVCDKNTCAICLDDIQLAEYAMVKGCGHAYCLDCIVSWAEERERRQKEASCPQCKTKFSYVFCYKQLDGSLSDGLLEESLTLLFRASWRADRGKGVLEDGGQPEDSGFDLDDFDFVEDDEDDDMLLARHHRAVLIGNRRFGANGFISNGRMLARPARPAPPPRPNKASPSSRAAPASRSSSGGSSSSAASSSRAVRTASGGSSTSDSAPAAASPAAAPASSPASSAAATARNNIRAKREAKEAQKAEKEAQKAARRRERLTQADQASAAAAAAMAAARIASEAAPEPGSKEEDSVAMPPAAATAAVC